MLNSPWRVESIEDAKVVFIPLPLDWIARNECNATETDYVREAVNIVRKTGFFPKVRHLVIADDFKSEKAASKL